VIANSRGTIGNLRNRDPNNIPLEVKTTLLLKNDDFDTDENRQYKLSNEELEEPGLSLSQKSQTED
jgi:hypothetical protein